MLNHLKRFLYRLGPRFPEDVQFAKSILRDQVARLSAGEPIETVAPHTQACLQPLRARGYSPLHIATICEAANQHVLIEKLMVAKAEQRAMAGQTIAGQG